MALTRPKVGQINTVVTAISDPIMVLNNGSTIANSDIGIVLNRSSGIDSNVSLFWQESTKKFVAALTSSNGTTNTIDVLTYADIKFGNLAVTGGIYSDQLYYANGTPVLDSITSDISVLTSNNETQTVDITALQSTAASQQNLITSLGTAITTANIAMTGYVNSTISSNIAVVTNKVNLLSNALTNEINRATSVEASLAADIITTSYIVTKSQQVFNLALTELARVDAARIATETELTGNLANLNARVEYVVSNIDPAALDSLSEIVSAYQATDARIDGSITALETRTIATESRLATEAITRAGADALQSSNLSQEISRATTVEAGLAADIITTSYIVTKSQQVFNLALTEMANLNTRIDSVLSNLDPAVIDSFTEVVGEFGAIRADLLGNIADETTARTGADSVLQSQIDDINNKYVKYTFQDSQVWTVLHNRNTKDYMEKIVDLNGNRMYATINNITDNSFNVTLTEAMSGSVNVLFG